jgi:hypothetical protein
MADAAKRKVDCVAVYKIDRFGRSVLHLNQQLAALTNSGVVQSAVNPLFILQPTATASYGKVYLQSLGSVGTKNSDFFLTNYDTGNIFLGTSAVAGSAATAITIANTGGVTLAGTLAVTGIATLKTLDITAGSNTKTGTGTLAAGTVTIANTSVTANSCIFVQSKQTSTANVGSLVVTSQTAGTGFVVKSTNAADTSPFVYWIIETA